MRDEVVAVVMIAQCESYRSAAGERLEQSLQRQVIRSEALLARQVAADDHAIGSETDDSGTTFSRFSKGLKPRYSFAGSVGMWVSERRAHRVLRRRLELRTGQHRSAAESLEEIAARSARVHDEAP